jgi:hypothetical protein
MTKYKSLLRTVQHLSGHQANQRMVPRSGNYRAAGLDRRSIEIGRASALPKPASMLVSLAAPGPDHHHQS